MIKQTTSAAEVCHQKEESDEFQEEAAACQPRRMNPTAYNKKIVSCRKTTRLIVQNALFCQVIHITANP